MRAIIVDDEPKAIELLKSYLEHFSGIQLAGTFRNGLKAFEFLSKEKTDLVFLDINMPHISGISLAKIIPAGTKVIFTTAYAEYAVESYEIQATDYLLKPISLERFTKAISKVLTASKTGAAETDKYIIPVKSGATIYRVQADDICYLEKSGNYMTWHCSSQKILSRETIHDALKTLPGNFIQSHKSFIVNMNKVSSVDKESINISGFTVPIGALYREKLLELLSK